VLMRIGLLACLLGVVVCAIFAAPVLAQNQVGDEQGASSPNWLDFFVFKGGKITLVLIVLSIVTIALIIEHAWSIRRATIIPAGAVERVQGYLEEKKYLAAIQFTAEEPSMMGHVLNGGLLEAANGYAAMERAIEESLEERAARLIRKTEYLNVIGNISPMIGLFGTVFGMILLFQAIYTADAFPPPRVVADKISVALITTFWGLFVAILALSFFAHFRNRIDVLTAECALVADQILSAFKPGAAHHQAVAQAAKERAQKQQKPPHAPSRA
jgi:biopolymer transport protein ExbB